MSVVLLGYRGSGKTTVGKIVAKRLGVGLVDTDSLIVEAAGMPIREIFAAKGEGYFRDLEHEQLQRALAEGHAVISTGGGIVVREENRRLLRESGRFAVYLHGDARTLHERITGDANSHISRPNLTNLGGGLEEIEYLLSIRDPLYREVAQLVVETGGRRPEEIAQEILRGCRERGLGG